MKAKLVILITLCTVFAAFCYGQESSVLKGNVQSADQNESLIGCSIKIPNTSTGTVTDIEGNFELTVDKLPVNLEFSFVGYENKIVNVVSTDFLQVRLNISSILFEEEVVVTGSRVSEQISKSPVSIQKVNAKQLANSSSGDFYQSLGNLREVDVTTASMGFQIVNTRGFNSTSPVRMVQFIDGMDNQAPGLNFPVGNLVGINSLDLHSVELISGAASALYGANAFQGVLSFKSMNPFDYPGFQLKVLGGSRARADIQARYAFTTTKEKRLGFKFTGGYFRANDWVADDPESNRYGDVTAEVNASGIVREMQFDDDPETASDFRALNAWLDFYPVALPGILEIDAPGYMENDLADNKTESIKLSAEAIYRMKNKMELSYLYKFGRGTAVYQGSNRYSINNILLQQHKLELGNDKFFVKAYSTLENAGDSYDLVFTAINLAKEGFGLFVEDYLGEYFDVLSDRTNEFKDQPYQEDVDTARMVATAYAQNSFLSPGSSKYDSLFNKITSDPDLNTGSKFQDKSALFHVEGQHNKDWTKFSLTTGAQTRLYFPRSFGTIFRDTLSNPADTLADGSPNPHAKFERLLVYDIGAYAQGTARLIGDKLKLVVSVRLDKSKNYDLQFSPKLSLVYSQNRHNFRITSQSAFRSPTLQNQYILLDLGAIFLKGNLEGNNNLYTQNSVEEFEDAVYNDQVIDPSLLKTFQLEPIRPEQVRSLEVGYKGPLEDNIYFDFTAYINFYKDFIGDIRVYEPTGGGIAGEETGVNAVLTQSYRLVQSPSNAKDKVITYGISPSLIFFIKRNLNISINHTFSGIKINSDVDDILPGFNTPRNKFNIGITGNKIWKGLGFSANFKWVDKYFWESTFGDGQVDKFNILDAQVLYEFPKHLTLRFGGNNILNNRHIEAFGSPLIGGVVYGAIELDLNRK